MIKTSTGLRNAALATGSVKAALALGFIDIYSNAVAAPATADDAIPGGAIKLCRISVNGSGTGISMDDAAVAGVLQKAPAEVWSGTNLAGGTALWYRHVGAADDGTLSTTQPRVQGDVSTAGAGLNLSSVTLTLGAPQAVDYYSLAWPTL